MPDGKPVIGPVPGLANVFLATGHEGGGLSLVIFCTDYLLKVMSSEGKIIHHFVPISGSRDCRNAHGYGARKF